MKKYLRWLFGTALLAGIIYMIIAHPLHSSVYYGKVYKEFAARAVYTLILASFLALYRILRGPTPADRIVAIDILGIIIIGLCAILAVSTGRSWYIDIGIAWALQSFISTLALAKYLEGKGFEE